MPHISTFPTIFVQKVRSKGALSGFLTGERAKPSLFVQHKLTQTMEKRALKNRINTTLYSLSSNNKQYQINNDDKSITRKINVLQSSKEEHEAALLPTKETSCTFEKRLANEAQAHDADMADAQAEPAALPLKVPELMT